VAPIALRDLQVAQDGRPLDGREALQDRVDLVAADARRYPVDATFGGTTPLPQGPSVASAADMASIGAFSVDSALAAFFRSFGATQKIAP